MDAGNVATVVALKVADTVQNKYFVAGCILGGSIVYRLVSQKQYVRCLSDAQPKSKGTNMMEGALDIRRKYQIVKGGPTDHSGEVTFIVDENFDIDRTIFGSISSSVLRYFQSAKLGVKLYWSDKLVGRAVSAFEKVPQAPKYDKPLVEFISNQCDFAMEHADGSFMDHLKFCYEYSYAHYPEKSARVLLLHSIMGVGTNFFPMGKEKIPELQSLLTEFEFLHIAMFPTVLRLFYQGPLRYELEDLVANNPKKLDRLKTIVMYRVIDNERMEVDAEEFWTQLNFQLIHLLDFLPAANWEHHLGDNFLDNFKAMYSILDSTNRLRAKVNFDASETTPSGGGEPATLAGILRGFLPSSLQLALGQRQISKFSKQIGHSLEYELVF